MESKDIKYNSGFTRSVENHDASVGSAHRASRFFTAGFTLVEVMISIGLFTVIMVIGIGAILGVNSTHRRTQAMRSVVDNLSFVMEDMARSMRLGDDFVCETSSVSALGQIDVANQATADGENCKSIAFEPYWNYVLNDDTNQIAYFIFEPNGSVGTIFKKTETMEWSDEMIAITPAEIDIDTAKSGFWVSGASETGVPIQPKVTIVLVGTVRMGNAMSEFNLQTTVSQRLLDIDSFN